MTRKKLIRKFHIVFICFIMVFSLSLCAFGDEVYDNTLDILLVRSLRSSSVGSASHSVAGYSVNSNGSITQYTSASSMQCGFLVFDLSAYKGQKVYISYTLNFIGSSLGVYNCGALFGTSTSASGFSTVQRANTCTTGTMYHGLSNSNGINCYVNYTGSNSITVSSTFTVSTSYYYVYLGGFCTSTACTQFQYSNIDMVVLDDSTADILNNIYTRLGSMQSSIGSIYSLLSTINGSISAILSDTASIDTSLSSINTKLSNIYNSLGSITTYMGNFQKGFFGSGTISAYSFYDLLKDKVFSEFFGHTAEDELVQDEIDNTINNYGSDISNQQENASSSISDMNTKFDELDKLENGYINSAITDIDSISTNFDFESNAHLFSALTFVSEQVTYVYNGLGAYQIVIVVGLSCGILVLVVGVAKNVRHEVHTPSFSHRKEKVK